VLFANNFFVSSVNIVSVYLCTLCNVMCGVQGPALYAYNNALFTEQDWTGIRMLQDSIKETDLMKIGQFGLGFKSVFHMTGTLE